MRTKPFALAAIVVALASSTNAGNPELTNPAAAMLDSKPAVAQASPAVDLGNIQQVVYGEPTCCAACAKKCQCHKRTRIVCEMVKVKKKYWTCECEDVGTMLPGVCFDFSLPHCGNKDCGDACCSDACGNGCDGDCPTTPKPGICRTRRTPVQKTYTEEVPVYKCVVDYCCSGGCADAVDSTIAGGSNQQTAKVAEPAVPKVALRPDTEGYGG